MDIASNKAHTHTHTHTHTLSLSLSLSDSVSLRWASLISTHFRHFLSRSKEIATSVTCYRQSIEPLLLLLLFTLPFTRAFSLSSLSRFLSPPPLSHTHSLFLPPPRFFFPSLPLPLPLHLSPPPLSPANTQSPGPIPRPSHTWPWRSSKSSGTIVARIIFAGGLARGVMACSPDNEAHLSLRPPPPLPPPPLLPPLPLEPSPQPAVSG